MKRHPSPTDGIPMFAAAAALALAFVLAPTAAWAADAGSADWIGPFTQKIFTAVGKLSCLTVVDGKSAATIIEDIFAVWLCKKSWELSLGAGDGADPKAAIWQIVKKSVEVFIIVSISSTVFSNASLTLTGAACGQGGGTSLASIAAKLTALVPFAKDAANACAGIGVAIIGIEAAFGRFKWSHLFALMFGLFLVLLFNLYYQFITAGT